MEDIIGAWHEMKLDTMKSSKIPISVCHAGTCSTKSRQNQMASVAHGRHRQQATIEQEETSDERKTRRREGDFHQGTKHWPGEKDDPLGNKESPHEGAKRERVKGQRPNSC